MTSSKDRKRIETLERENELLQKRITLLEIQNADMRRALERRDMWAQAGAISQGEIDRQIEKVQTERDELRARVYELERRYMLLERFAQPDLMRFRLPNGKIGTHNELRDEFRQHVEAGADVDTFAEGSVLIFTKQQLMPLAYMIAGHDAETDDSFVIGGQGFFLGGLGELRSMFESQIGPKIHGLPTMDDLKSPYLETVLSPHAPISTADRRTMRAMQLAAVQALIFHWRDEALRKKFDDLLDEVIDKLFELELFKRRISEYSGIGESPRATARKRLRESVRNTFEGMTKRENSTA